LCSCATSLKRTLSSVALAACIQSAYGRQRRASIASAAASCSPARSGPGGSCIGECRGVRGGMIEHISLRCKNPRTSRKFYEKALAPLGYQMDKEYGEAFGFAQDGRHDFWVTKGKVGTPAHLAFHAGNKAAVDAFYRAAMAAGGKDNGAPGPREEYGYAAFVLDPDGHNVEAVIWDEELKPAKKRRKAKKR
jgi:catechol 2,3-dioxygenase-like lactoylglutathione lyase family enzyme